MWTHMMKLMISVYHVTEEHKHFVEVQTDKI